LKHGTLPDAKLCKIDDSVKWNRSEHYSNYWASPAPCSQ